MQATASLSPASQADALAAWLRLAHTPGVGPATVQLLLDTFHTAQAAFAATPSQLSAVLPPHRAAALLAPLSDEVSDQIAAALAWQAGPGRYILTRDDPRYPPLLREIADPPALLYAIGRIELLQGSAMAVVGSRNASLQGQANARAFSQALSEAGLTIVSGLAAGIDAAAHEGGLRGIGSTVAVMGTGPDRVYPSRNRALAHAIAESGCLLSEYPLGTPPLPSNFPRRNRIISGLSCGVLVVEAAAGSGSLITARVANDQGRDVFAIPGSIHAPLAKGCHQLIKQGAKLVECADDVLQELCMAPLAALPPALAHHGSPSQDKLLDAMGYDPIDGDTLAALPGMSAATLATRLLALELSGEVERLPGGLFQRVNR